MRPAKALESEEQRDVTKLVRRLGGNVVSFSQPRRTMQTPGIPDLKIYFPARGLTWWQEMKRMEGGKMTKQRKEQVEFQVMAEKCGEVYVKGGYDSVVKHMESVGILAVTHQGGRD